MSLDQVQADSSVISALNAAEEQAKSMKDEYVSVEHLLLGLMETAQGGVKRLFDTYRVTKEAVLQALAGRPGKPAGYHRQPGGHL